MKKKPRENDIIKGAKQALKDLKDREMKALIHEMNVLKDEKEEEYHQLRDDMQYAQGELGQIEVLIYKLEEMVK